MNPVSLSSGFFPPPLPQLRPELAIQRQLGGIGDQVKEPSLDPLRAPGTQGSAPVGFDNLMGKLVREVNGKQMAAGDAVTGVLSGQNIPLHQAMIAMEEASVSFQLMVEVRNKLLEGYQELLRMQV